MGYEHLHLSWDLAWPWLNLGNALGSTPKLIQWYEFTGARGGTLWIILTNFALLKGYHTYREKGLAAPAWFCAAILVLLGFLVFMNAIAVLLRRRFERRW